MGGFDRGRASTRVSIEACRRLDIRLLRRWRVPDFGWSGTWSWKQDGESTGSIDYQMIDGAMVLTYTITDDRGNRTPVRINVPISSVPCRYGGRRRYFACPHCGRRCEVIVMTTSGRSWGCRRCLPLRYASQALSPAWRMQERAKALYERAGTDYGEGIVIKRKWMRWRTYNRLMVRANRLDRLADLLFACRWIEHSGMSLEEIFTALRVEA